jgi:quercetin dioxygenase-like cupin family protein
VSRETVARGEKVIRPRECPAEIGKEKEMANAGDTIEHPVTGERFKFLKTAEDTNGKLLRMEVLVEPRGFAAAEHIHPKQNERFEILSGKLRLRIAGSARVEEAGDIVDLPQGVPHVWQNGGDENLRMILEFRPALKTEAFFESFFGLGQDGMTSPKTGLPSLLRMAVLLRGFEDEIYLARPPLFVQRLVFGMLAFVGGLLGYRAEYPYPYTEQREASPFAS